MLEGKTVLITGSSRGIGAATARKVIEYGGRAILHGKTESDELKALADELRVPYVVADVTDTAAVKAAVEHAIGYGSVEGLVTCAGEKSPGFNESSDEDWLATYEANVLGTVRFVRALIPHFQEQGSGSAVLISSIYGYQIKTNASPYAASKAVVTNLAAGLANEFGPTVRVNAVAPGFVDTDMTKSATDDANKRYTRSIMGRLARPEEIAEPVCFLLSDRASFITGQTILADGGYLFLREK